MSAEVELARKERDEVIEAFHKFFLMARSGVWDRREELRAQVFLEAWGMDCSEDEDGKPD